MKIRYYGERLASLDEAIEARYFIIEQELRLLWRSAMADEAFLLKQEPRLRLIIDGLAELRGLPGAKLPYYLNEALRRLQGKTLNGMLAETWKGLHIESKICATIAYEPEILDELRRLYAERNTAQQEAESHLRELENKLAQETERFVQLEVWADFIRRRNEGIDSYDAAPSASTGQQGIRSKDVWGFLWTCLLSITKFIYRKPNAKTLVQSCSLSYNEDVLKCYEAIDNCYIEILQLQYNGSIDASISDRTDYVLDLLGWPFQAIPEHFISDEALLRIRNQLAEAQLIED